MPTIHDLKKSRFLTKEDVGPGKLLTIKGWHEENVALLGDPPENKYCLDFEETDKPLVLNTTKGQVIARICGNEDLDNWGGYRIVAYHDPNISMGGKIVGGIAVRAPRLPAAAVPPATRTAAAKPAPGPARPVAAAEDTQAPPPEPEGDDVPF